MLKLLRKNTKIIIWSVIICFVLWGGYSVGAQFKKKGRYAGEVFGKPVTFQEYSRFVQSGEIFTLTGQSVDDPDVLHYQAWQNIIYSREAKRLKIDVTDDDVRNEIRRIFQTMGVQEVTPEMYKNWLQSRVRMIPRDFEAQVRELLRIQKLINHIRQQPIEPPTKEAAQKLYLIENRKLKVEFAKFNLREEASAFAAEYSGIKDWNKIKSGKPNLPIEVTDLLPLSTLSQKLQLPPATIEELFKLEKNTISDPIQMGLSYAIFYVSDKKDADEKEFEKQKQEYLDKLAVLNKQKLLLQWNFELMHRANLKDYTPEAKQQV